MMVMAILASRTERHPTWRPVLLAVGATLVATAGFLVVFILKQQYQKPHFLTPHSHLGLLTFFAVLMYTVISLVGFNPRTAEKRRNPQPANRFRVSLGKLIVVLGLLTASAGILELERRTFPNAVAWIGTLVCFVPLIS